MKSFIIDVTQDDITNAKGKGCNNCPIHRAVYRATGFPYFVGWVNVYRDAWLCDPVAKLPEEAVKFIDDLSFGKPVKPFAFMLNLSEVPA